MREDLTMLPIGEIVVRSSRGGLDADHWTRREFMLGDKKAGPFKLEVAWVKVIDGKNGK